MTRQVFIAALKRYATQRRGANQIRYPEKARIKSFIATEYELHPSPRQGFLLNYVKDTSLTFFSRQ
jgi:hypothetical protein